MVRFYVRKLKDGDITMKDVAKKWYKQTEEELIRQGYKINEDGTVTYIGVD